MKEKAKIVVVGSSNIDMVVKTDRIPRAGETVLGGEFVMVPGGKGANQAVCAAKLGADVSLVSRIGNDVFGEMSLANFHREGVDTTFVVKDDLHASGVALIAVDRNGENAIVVAPGANTALSPEDVNRAEEAIAAADAIVLQLEIPQETVAHTVELARSHGKRVVLNPAPIRQFPMHILRHVDVLTPNQHEAASLIGAEGEGNNLDVQEAVAALLDMGVAAVIITLGSDGAYVATHERAEKIEAVKVPVVDTTAAGDAFTGSLACALAEGKDLFEAARFAAKVAGISVTRMGAQSSMPTRYEVESYKFGN